MLKRRSNMYRVSRLTLICCLITFTATYGQAQQLYGEFYEYEDQISIESRSGAAETVVMPEDLPNSPKSDKEKIDLIKEKMFQRRSGLVTRNNGQPVTANTDDLAVRVLPPANFRTPLSRTSQSRSSTTTATSSTTTTTTVVPEVETDSRPKVRRTRPNGNRLRSTTTSTTAAPTTTTEETTMTAATPAAEPEPPATLTERKDEASLEDVVNISPLFRESVHRIDTVPEHTRDTAYFREQPIAELPIPNFPRAKELPTPMNETMDGVPIYFMSTEITNETNDQPSTTVTPINEDIVPVTQESEAEYTTIFQDRMDEGILEDEEEFLEINSDRRSDEVEGSRQFQRKLLDMMVSETKNILTAIMPDRAALAAFKYFPLFEPQIESRSSNNEPNYGYNSQQRPRPPPRHRPPPKSNPHANTRPSHAHRRPPPPRHPHEKPETHHGKHQHGHGSGHEPQPPANFEPYEPFSINFQPPKEPDFRKKPEPNYKPSQPLDSPKYEQPSSPKPPSPQYPSEQSYKPEYPKEPTYVPEPPKEPTYVPQPPKEPVHKPGYPQEPAYKPADPKPSLSEKPYPQVTEQYPKVPQYPSGDTEKPYEKPQVPNYPKEPVYEPVYPSAPQQDKTYEKPTPSPYPQEPTYKATSAPTLQHEKPNAPQYPKEVAYETAPSPVQYEKPYAKPIAPKEPAYEPSYPFAPKDEKPYPRPPVSQYPKKPVHETSSSAPQYEKPSRNPYEKPTQVSPKEPTYQPTYPQPPKNDKPYETAPAPHYPKAPAYPPATQTNVPAYAPAYAPITQYEKPASQYPKETTYDAAQAPALQSYKPVPAVQYPKEPAFDTSSPVPQYTRAPTPVPYVTTRQYPKKSHSTQAPRYPQENYYSSPKPPVSSTAPYVEPINTYQKSTSPPVYHVVTPEPYQPYGYNRPVKPYRVKSTPAPSTTTQVPYQESYPDQPQQPSYPSAQQYPEKPYRSPELQQYYPQQYNQYTQEEPTRPKGSNSRKTPTRGYHPTQEQTVQNKKPQSTDASYDDTPFEQIDPVPETEYQQSQQYSVSATAPSQYKTKKPSSNQRNRVTTPKPPSYAEQFPPRRPSLGFEGQQWAADDITADKFPDFKISSFFQDTPWPQQESYISQNGGSQRQPTQPKRKGGNSQRLQQPLHGELTGKSALKTEELLGLVAPDMPSEVQVEKQRNPEAVFDSEDADYAAIPAKSSPSLTDARNTEETNKHPPKEAEDPSAESAVIATPTATRRKETHTRPRIQNHRITKPKPELE